MATPTASEVRTISLTTMFDAVADPVIDQAVLEASFSYGGIAARPEHTTIVALRACHEMYITSAAGIDQDQLGGPVTSATAGAVSMTKATQVPPAPSPDDGGKWSPFLDRLRQLERIQLWSGRVV
ncbi:MAG: hypothetical protein ACPG4T_19815 [Nannocystaceae bacterium]